MSRLCSLILNFFLLLLIVARAQVNLKDASSIPKGVGQIVKEIRDVINFRDDEISPTDINTKIQILVNESGLSDKEIANVYQNVMEGYVYPVIDEESGTHFTNPNFTLVKNSYQQSGYLDDDVNLFIIETELHLGVDNTSEYLEFVTENYSGEVLKKKLYRAFQKLSYGDRTNDYISIINEFLKLELTSVDLGSILSPIFLNHPPSGLDPRLKSLISKHFKMFKNAKVFQHSFACSQVQNIFTASDYSRRQRTRKNQESYENGLLTEKEYSAILQYHSDNYSRDSLVNRDVIEYNKNRVSTLVELGFNLDEDCGAGLTAREMIDLMILEGELGEEFLEKEGVYNPCTHLQELNLGGVCDIAKVITKLTELENDNTWYYGERNYFSGVIENTIGVNDGCTIEVFETMLSINNEIQYRNFDVRIEGRKIEFEQMERVIDTLRYYMTK